MGKYFGPRRDLDRQIREEFEEVEKTLLNPVSETVTLAVQNAEPARYTDGMIVYADGTNWNPGSGEGAYIRYNSAWNYLG